MHTRVITWINGILCDIIIEYNHEIISPSNGVINQPEVMVSTLSYFNPVCSPGQCIQIIGLRSYAILYQDAFVLGNSSKCQALMKAMQMVSHQYEIWPFLK